MSEESRRRSLIVRDAKARPRPLPYGPSKSELQQMLSEAVRNTAASIADHEGE